MTSCKKKKEFDLSCSYTTLILIDVNVKYSNLNMCSKLKIYGYKFYLIQCVFKLENKKPG